MSNHLKRKRKLGEEADFEPLHDFFTEFIGQKLGELDRQQLKQPKKLRGFVKKQLLGIGSSLVVNGTSHTFDDENLTPKSVSWNEGLAKNFTAQQDELTPENQTLFNIINRYADMLAFPTSKDHRDIYIAHIVNHIIRTRNLVIQNKQKLAAAQEKVHCLLIERRTQIQDDVSEELVESLRDQGFVRPTVLVLCPFKKDAYDLVQRLKQLIFGGSKPDVMKGARFESEFSSPQEAPEFDDAIDEDTRELLTGNNDDCFRLGIALSKKTLKLFEPFERADILLCSPLGLRMILEKEVGEESHLISSLNISVLDGMDVMLQQNWQNVTLIFEKMLQQPSKINTEISRVRQYFLDGDSKHFHQLLAFSKHPHELFTALVLKESLNHRGLVVAQPSKEGTLDNILIPLCQELHRFDVKPGADQSDSRFDYFKSQILSTLKTRTCLVIPSYFDFVRLRNHLKRMEESFVACHEYADKTKIKRAKDLFFHERKSYLLVTERFYYFNRRRLRGIDQIVFYQLPSHPKFYSDFINMARDQQGRRFKAVLLYTRSDRTRLENTFGSEMAAGILSSDKTVQAIVSE